MRKGLSLSACSPPATAAAISTMTARSSLPAAVKKMGLTECSIMALKHAMYIVLIGTSLGRAKEAMKSISSQ